MHGPAPFQRLTTMVSSLGLLPLPSRADVKPYRLRTFVDEHYDRLWRILRRFGVPAHRVEDAAQEVLLVLARRMHDIPTGAEWSFVCSTARRIASEGRRRESVRPQGEGDRNLLSLPDPKSGDALTALHERQLLDRLLDGLPDDQREAIVLVELEGMTMAEVAELSNVPQGTIASRLRRARAHLDAAAKEMRASLAQQGWIV